MPETIRRSKSVIRSGLNATIHGARSFFFIRLYVKKVKQVLIRIEQEYVSYYSSISRCNKYKKKAINPCEKSILKIIILPNNNQK